MPLHKKTKIQSNTNKSTPLHYSEKREHASQNHFDNNLRKIQLQSC